MPKVISFPLSQKVNRIERGKGVEMFGSELGGIGATETSSRCEAGVPTPTRTAQLRERLEELGPGQ